MEHETLWSLLCDVNHWIFELILMALFDGLIGAVIWPRLRQWKSHHQSDDDKLDRLAKQLKTIQEKLGIKDEEES